MTSEKTKIKEPIWKRWWFSPILQILFLIAIIYIPGYIETERKLAASTEFYKYIDDCRIKYISSKLGTDIYGNDIVIFTFEFENHGTENKSFDRWFDNKAFQNDVELSKGYVFDYEYLDNNLKDVKTGEKTFISRAYNPIDESKLTLGLYNYSDSSWLYFTIDIPNEETSKPQSVAESKFEKDIADYHVKYIASHLDTDYVGNNVIIVTYEFTNNGVEDKSFSGELRNKAFQSGVDLSEGYMPSGKYKDNNFDSEYEYNNYRDLKEDEKTFVYCAYEIKNKSEITLEFNSPSSIFKKSKKTFFTLDVPTE